MAVAGRVGGFCLNDAHREFRAGGGRRKSAGLVPDLCRRSAQITRIRASRLVPSRSGRCVYRRPAASGASGPARPPPPGQPRHRPAGARRAPESPCRQSNAASLRGGHLDRVAYLTSRCAFRAPASASRRRQATLVHHAGNPANVQPDGARARRGPRLRQPQPHQPRRRLAHQRALP